MATSLSISVWDWDRASKNDLVARTSYSLDKIPQDSTFDGQGPYNTTIYEEEDDEEHDSEWIGKEEKSISTNSLHVIKQKRWFNLYGPPHKKLNKKQAEVIQSTSSSALISKKASTFRGRLLFGFRQVLHPSSDREEIVHSEDIEDPNWSESLPSTVRYTFRLILYLGTDLPKLVSGPLKSPLFLSIQIRSIEIQFESGNVHENQIIWNESKEKRGLILPADYSQLPDVILYLNYQTSNSKEDAIHLSYIRLSASKLIHQNFKQTLKWLPLRAEFTRQNTKYAVALDAFPGTILCQIGFGREEVAA